MRRKKLASYFFREAEMRERIVKLETECEKNKYRAWYRCSNCGTIFQYDMQRGTTATNMRGECTVCGCKSGSPNVAIFQMVKYNPQQDAVQRHYFK